MFVAGLLYPESPSRRRGPRRDPEEWPKFKKAPEFYS